MTPEDKALELFLEKNANLRRFLRHDLPIGLYRGRELMRGAQTLWKILNTPPMLAYTPQTPQTAQPGYAQPEIFA